MKKRNYTFFAFLLTCAVLQAQQKETQKAEKEFTDYAYADAIETYEDLVKDGHDDGQIFKNLGNANYLNANYQKAADWYGKLFELEETDPETDYMYRYAQTLKSNGEYEASKKWMQKFEAATENDRRAKKFADNPDYLEDIERLSGRYDLENLSINSAASDFAPAFKRDALVFSTARDTGTVSRNIHGWNNKPFLNLYEASGLMDGEFMQPVKLSKNLNKKTHESSAVFTKDGTTVYFTRNNSEKGRFSRDEEGVSRLKIYRATLKDEEWTDITELPFNGDSHSTAHPALSADGSRLYFASDREGSLGQSDIFVVDILEDGSFGTPQNLGDRVNTEARETFPFVTESNLLYFASDGHPGLGGLDIYATQLNESYEAAIISDDAIIVNVGKPVNGEQDDFSLIIDESTKKGFFASNRNGGNGDDDIYGFTETRAMDFTCKAMVEGTVRELETGEPIAGTVVSIIDATGKKLEETNTLRDGTYSIESRCGVVGYQLMAVKDSYNKTQETLSNNNTKGIVRTAITKVDFFLEKAIKPAAVGTDLFKHLELEPIHFDSNKAGVRPDAALVLAKIITYMTEFPQLKVQVRSHTDAVGSTAYNLKLSEERAQSTVTFLISKGIAASRLSGKGLGETELVNDCKSREICSSEKHQENRRSEFVVVE